jgi:tetratricopeptide (TPR) repeat protein
MSLSREDLIEQKVFSSLSSSQKVEFDLLLISDKSFAQDYRIMNDLASYMAKDNLYNFREKLSAIHDKYQSRKPIRIIHLNKIWYQVASVAAILLIMFGSYYLINQPRSAAELFNDYYQLDDVYLNTRSGNSLNTGVLEQGLILFEKDKYRESISYFEKLPNSITAIYYSGVAHMELGDYDVACYKFELVIKDYLNVFYDQALWYKGLCLIKQGRMKDAKRIMKDISKTDSYYRIQAKELLGELK